MSLKKTEEKYAQVDKEGLSIVFGIKKVTHFLYGSSGNTEQVVSGSGPQFVAQEFKEFLTRDELIWRSTWTSWLLYLTNGPELVQLGPVAATNWAWTLLRAASELGDGEVEGELRGNFFAQDGRQDTGVTQVRCGMLPGMSPLVVLVMRGRTCH
eukprot:g42525.t1